jgi:hypothetical protein
MSHSPLYRKVHTGKSARYVEIPIPTDAKPNDNPMNDRQKTMLLHIALAAFETVRSAETPKSARYTRMNNSIDRILDQIDIYRPDAWPPKDVSKAGALVDIFNVMIAAEFGREL